MDEHHYLTPTARAPVADTNLFRPDWTGGVPRKPNLLWLDKNENSDPELAEVVQRVLAEIPLDSLYSYPESGPLYRKIAARLGVGPENLLLSAGSDGAIRSAFVSPVTVPSGSLIWMSTRSPSDTCCSSVAI